MAIRVISMKSFIRSIVELREEFIKGLNTDFYTHIKPGQDRFYVSKMSEMIHTYLWLKERL